MAAIFSTGGNANEFLNLNLGTRNGNFELKGGFYLDQPEKAEKGFQIGAGVTAAFDDKTRHLSVEFVKYLGDRGETRLLGSVGLRGPITNEINLFAQLQPGLRVRENNVDPLFNGTLDVELPISKRMLISGGLGLYGEPENKNLLDALGGQVKLLVAWE